MATPLRSSVHIIIVLLTCLVARRGSAFVSAWSTPTKSSLFPKTPAFHSQLSTTASPNGAAASMSDSSPPSSVLFVGNSLTYVHNVDQWVQKLRESSVGGGGGSSSSPALDIAKCVKGGASLKKLWQKTKAKREIAQGEFDMVVIQEDLPETTVELFEKFCRKFVAAARDANAKPLLYQTWAYGRLPDVTDEDICRAHRSISEELGVEVADVGSARLRIAEEMPHLNLWSSDMEHPSEVGAYLAALVLYRAMFQEPTLGIADRPELLEEKDAILLQTFVDNFDSEENE